MRTKLLFDLKVIRHGMKGQVVAYTASSLPILPQGEQLPRAICFSALLCSHYKIHLY
jgi:hypothetical protein